MKTYRDILEATQSYDKKIYKVGNYIWVAYGQGSGNTYQLKGSYVTSKKGDEFEDKKLVEEFLKYSLTATPIKSDVQNGKEIFELPVYTKEGNVDIWGGTEKPKSIEYYIVSSKGVPVITFFKTKSEALNWFKFSN